VSRPIDQRLRRRAWDESTA